MLYFSGMRALTGRGFVVFFGFLLLCWAAFIQAAPPGALEQERIAAVLPGVTSISEQEGEFGVRTLKQGDEIVGYAFETINIAPIPAYSGKPMNMQVILGPEGNILDNYVLYHDEPILLIGIPEQKLHDFAGK